ncbi:SDR family NAD(P)-dependent oxidoreductase [Micromonospora sp. NPDC005203]|uniref:SDR family NAD(P)-dependent oxidoreductase n=1 Tax=Micromonospora sp. NPDC005203 TaxID=3364226 RepID=UPI0036CD18F4
MTVATVSPPGAPALRPHLVSFTTESFVRPVERFVWTPVPAARPVTARVADVGPLLVVGNDVALAEGVAARLRARGLAVDVAAPGVEPAPAAWGGVVDLNVAGARYSPGDGDWRSALDRSVRMLAHRYPDWAAQPLANGCWYLVVTVMGGKMGYDDAPIEQPLGGIWAGLAKGLVRELPNLAIKVVDFDRPDAVRIADVVHAELGSWDQFEVGYAGDERYVLEARRQDAPEPRLDLGADDLVLISGGARGVGFALAEHLAREFGCHVVVTGRSAMSIDEPWLALDDAAFEEYRRAEVAAATSATGLREVREVLRRQAELRAVHHNVTAARDAGLRITYRACDCADEAQVAALFDTVGAPTVIVHNAGIDLPKRLAEKRPEEVVDTVDVKVTGFANLVNQVLADDGRRATLKMFCNVGSLAGRLGGMVGQIDYAAGNEALARLGFWAHRTHGLPAQTLCWPTWERLGVITNYDNAVRYVSTIAPDDGVRRWTDEMRAGTTSEVMFIGRIGVALVPSMLRGFWRFTGHPDLPRLHSLAHFLGEVELFEPFAQLRSAVTHRAGDQPCLAGEFTVDGVPALPVSVLIEQMCSVADWVAPPGWPRRHLVELSDVSVQFDALRLREEGTRFVNHAVGADTPNGWTVTVAVLGDGGEPAATATLRYAEDPPEPSALAATFPPAADAPPRSGGPRLRWSGLAIGRPRWRVGHDGGHSADLSAGTAADLWTMPFPPTAAICPTALEAAVATAAAAGTGRRVSVQRIVARPGAQRVDRLVGSSDGRHWTGLAADEPVLQLTGLRVTGG